MLKQEGKLSKKRCGRTDELIQIIQAKLKQIEICSDFGGKRVKVGRSQGKKKDITIEQEYARLLGNLPWAYLQQGKYKSAKEMYRNSLSFELDRNKQCNLAVCLMHMNRMTEAKLLTEKAIFSSDTLERCSHLEMQIRSHDYDHVACQSCDLFWKFMVMFVGKMMALPTSKESSLCKRMALIRTQEPSLYSRPWGKLLHNIP